MSGKPSFGIPDSFLLENRFLVTGGAGFIGSHLVEYLLERGAFVRVLDNLSTGFKENLAPFTSSDFEFFEGDIRDQRDCKNSVEGIDIVLHQAALGSVPRSINDPVTSNNVNVGGFLNMIEAAKDSGVKSFVYASSSSVYGDHPGLPKVEKNIGKPLSPYALTKLINEQYAEVFFQSYGFASTGLRYFNVFGPRQSPEGPYAAVLPLFAKAILNSQPPTIHGDGEQTRDFTFIMNAVQANLLAAFNRLSGANVFNVACSERVSVNQLFEKIKSVAGSSLEVIHGPERAGDVRDSLADISSIRSELGYDNLVNIDQGLKTTWEWYSSNLLES